MFFLVKSVDCIVKFCIYILCYSGNVEYVYKIYFIFKWVLERWIIKIVVNDSCVFVFFGLEFMVVGLICC